MKLSIEGIKDKKEWEKAGIKLPSYDVEKVATATKEAPVWVHFGIGNIFRIFIGGIADSLLEQGLSDKESLVLKHLIMMWLIRYTHHLIILLWLLH